MGVFRIARAEFIKIFKKPSVYIMGVVLASVLVLSLFFFEPVGKQDYTVKLEGKTVSEIYDKFVNDNNVAGGDNRQSKFDAKINESVNKLEFYSALNSHNAELSRLNTEFPSLFQDLVNAVENKELTATDVNKVYQDVKNKLIEYNAVYGNVDFLKAESEFYTIYSKTELFTKSFDLLEKLKEFSNTDTASAFVNRVRNNNYISDLNSIYETNLNFISETLNLVLKEIKLNYTSFYSSITKPNPSYPEQYLDENIKLTASVKKAEQYTKALVENKYNLVLVEKEEYEKINNVYTYVLTQLASYLTNEDTSISTKEKHETIAKNLENSKFVDSISNFNKKIKTFNVETETIKSLQKTITERITELKNGINESIVTLNTSQGSANDTKNKALMNELITNYKVLSINTTSLVDTSINLDATKNISSTNITKYLHFTEYNTYEARENLTRTLYFIDNGVYNQNYNDVFAFNKNSGIETNAYDFMFFAMKIATLIISAFAILMAASLMASEFDSGTIKLLAMRPFKRWKILTGKLMATMFFVLVFILFSFLISFVAGICMYPLTSTPILAVLSGSVAFAIHPILLMFIQIAFIILEVFFFAVLALSISTVFRSYTAAISISFVTFLLAISLNILLGNAFWYSFIPFMNVDFFRFFGGSFLPIATGGINSLFTPILLSNANIFISLGIFAGTILILLTITYIVFKRRDF